MEASKLSAHSHALYDREASRKPRSLSMNSDLLEKARELGVDVATTLEEALASEVHKRQREAWLEGEPGGDRSLQRSRRAGWRVQHRVAGLLMPQLTI